MDQSESGRICITEQTDRLGNSTGRGIYTGAFRTSPVELLHVEANDPPLELGRNELGLGFLYKLKINCSYIETLNTLDNNKDQNYEVKKKINKTYRSVPEKTGT